MALKDRVAQAEALLAVIDRGEPPQPCWKWADELRHVLQLFREAGETERGERIEWEYRICLLFEPTCISWEREEPRARFPSLNDLEREPEAMQYFAERALQMDNCVLKACYCDFLWEKSNLPDRHQYAKMAVDAYLETAQQFAALEGLPYPLEMIDAWNRATELALSLNDEEKLGEIVRILEKLMEHLSALDGGRWALEPMETILQIRQKRRHIVEDALLDNLQTKAEELARENENYFVVEAFLDVAIQAAGLLKKEEEEVYRLARRLGETIESQAEAYLRMDPPQHIVAAFYYEQAVKYYRRSLDKPLFAKWREELKERIKRLRREIRQAYRLWLSEIQPVIVEQEIPWEEVEGRLRPLLEPENVEESLRLLAEDDSWIPPIPPSNARDPLLRIETLPRIEVNSYFLCELFSRLESKGLTAERLGNYLASTLPLEEGKLAILRVGLERYFCRDFVSALHILVPGFEDAFRTLLAQSGELVEKPIQIKKGEQTIEGWRSKGLGELLGEDLSLRILPYELRTYIQLVMTEPIGWNLRNRVAHGLVHPVQCSKQVLDTVLHLFLLLTRFSKGRTEEEEDEP